ncbi:MAG TPA: ABC transporter permease [Firmicutes bacterium]|nr:ABC transporter permease [Bacillota bacterium]
MAAIKLAERGVDPSILMPPQVTSENTAPKEKRGGLILAMILPTIITIWASIGGMYTAIDVAAGEKERGTLEPLIVTPPSRDSLVIGKFLAVLTVSAITVLLVVGGILVALRFGDLAGAMGDDKAEFVLPVARAIGIFLIGFLLASLTSAIEITLSIFARSFKEAQNYITPLYIAVMVPGVLSQISSAGGTSPAPWYFLIPVANAVEIFKELLLGTINWNHIGITAGSSLIYAILALMAAIRIFSREDVLFR